PASVPSTSAAALLSRTAGDNQQRSGGYGRLSVRPKPCACGGRTSEDALAARFLPFCLFRQRAGDQGK
ncbi:hypothetical protein, partial [Pantoea ananatis]|uniref:hypothetical protein n=1 Tax=Pantoea ananas TaxID=553 RepID=UPI001E62B3C2